MVKNYLKVELVIGLIKCFILILMKLFFEIQNFAIRVKIKLYYVLNIEMIRILMFMSLKIRKDCKIYINHLVLLALL